MDDLPQTMFETQDHKVALWVEGRWDLSKEYLQLSKIGIISPQGFQKEEWREESNKKRGESCWDIITISVLVVFFYTLFPHLLSINIFHITGTAFSQTFP